MFFRFNHMVLPFLVAVVLLCSCASYNQQSTAYYSQLVKGDYDKAAEMLDQNKLLRKSRNRLLFLMERGKVEHLRGNFEASNRLLNEADLLMEDQRYSVRDLALGYLMNPMMETYRGEDFEKYMLHYYKALNYLQLNQPLEALVEAKRISLRANFQDDVTGEKRYAKDAFSMMLQGLIYEKNGDHNNAFIAYRNAVELYLEKNGVFYGTSIPLQLKKDLIRSAYLNGFTEEQQKYEQLFQMNLDSSELNREAEMILFWESGLAPVKTEHNLLFNLAKQQDGNYYFSDYRGRYNLPFAAAANYSDDNLALLTALRVVVPRYEVQPSEFQAAVLYKDSARFALENAQDITTLAVTTLEERWHMELIKTLTRLAIKKLAEHAASPEKKDEETEKEKKERHRKEAFAAGLKIFNFATEKADTRNWQSLPGMISYVRVPLSEGANNFKLVVQGRSRSLTYNISCMAAPGLQFRSLSTLRP